MTCCSVVIELSHQLLHLQDPEIYRQGFEMLSLMLILGLLSSRKWDCKKDSGAHRIQAEVCNRRKRVCCLNRDECLAFPNHSVSDHENLCTLGHFLAKPLH